MERRHHLSREEMKRAVGMLPAGSKQRTVAVALGITQSVISRLWTCYRITGSASPLADRTGLSPPEITFVGLSSTTSTPMLFIKSSANVV
ncbi:putative DNA-mediated transposase [Operophtera brumata]|uniref:Putative DNA-mediated transposase n=1 Tax=Operophtera brumata TaxID=104452 RepID=A0A0L7LCR2_OPEBR|nr:putative DNA-mediated transposase [Operophtera brumata]